MTRTAYQELKKTNALPSPNGVALEILRLVGDKEATLDSISGVVEADPALAGRMLKLANSSFTGQSRKVNSVSVAVKLLGLRVVKNLALGLSLLANNREGYCRAFDYETFWTESLARAVAARHIAGLLKIFSPDEAFATGLLGQIGRIALATVRPDEYSRVLLSLRNNHPAELMSMEQKEFGIDHNGLAAEMMADWYMQEILCNAVRIQDNPDRIDSESNTRIKQLAQLLNLAGTFALLLVQPEANAHHLPTLMEKTGALGITQYSFDHIFETIKDEWAEAGTIFSVSTTEVPPLEILCEQNQPDIFSSNNSSISGENTSITKNAVPNELRILAVDDDDATLRLLTHYLTGAGYQVTTASNGIEALEADRREAPQIVITDWKMPEMDGLELCRRLRANEEVGFVYIFVLTAHSEKEKVVEALEAGADDFLAKPFSREEILAHVRSGERIVRLETRLAERSHEIARTNAELAVANDKLRIMATTDELTGLINRREGLARLAEYWSYADRYNEPLSCIVADIDHFKRINDTYGHSGGDTILKATAANLERSSRTEEVVCRTGGEEFLVICPKSSSEVALKAAERLRISIESDTVAINEHNASVTISMGVSEKKKYMSCPDDMLKEADEMLYAAKEAGRNRVFVKSEKSTSSMIKTP